MDSLGLYVHVPFCTTKCGYCDFYSVTLEGRNTGRAAACLRRELGARSQELDIGPSTVFMGGGTPTLLPHADLRALLDCVGRHLKPQRLQEFTVEANPATLDDAMATLLLGAGVNRISLGAQSFEMADLAVLERIHDPADIEASLRTARRTGFERLNLDLMFGIPGQSLQGWLSNLNRAVDLAPDHLACYGLTYEPGTALTARRDRGLIVPCVEDLEAEMYLACIDTLADAGYEQYEISNFARPGQRCLHNVNTWRNRPYVGVGPSAASYIDRVRRRNVPNLDRYIQMIELQGTACVDTEALDALERAGESAMLALRTTEGIPVKRFREETGFDPLLLFRDQVGRFQELGLLESFEDRISPDDRHIRLTRRGFLLADAVMAEFLKPEFATK